MAPPDNLPASVRQLIELVGAGPALALVLAFPGNLIKVPMGVQDSPMAARLEEVMGSAAARVLMANYGGERITIARCVGAARDARDRQIIADYDAGRSVAELAREHRLTERQVRTNLKRTFPTAGSGSASDSHGGSAQISLF